MSATSDESQGTAPIQRRYAAFISYRHDDNRQEGRRWAGWLHHSLETYEVPADLVGKRGARGQEIPARIFPVFRDEEELPADADLAAPIRSALEASDFLVVLCSPGAVASTFVADEIRTFKMLGKQDRIIAAILSGEPNAARDDNKAGAHAECFPAPLRVEVRPDGTLTDTPVEPLAADFRLEDGREGWTTPEAHRQALLAEGVARADAARRADAYAARLHMMRLKIIAGIVGVPLGVLTQRDEQYALEKARRRAVVLRRWLAAVALLAVLAVGAGLHALERRREADARRAEAVETLANADFQRGTRLLDDPRTSAHGIALLARAARRGQHAGALFRLWTLRHQRAFWVPGDDRAPPPLPTPKAVPDEIRTRFATVRFQGKDVAPHDLAVSEDGNTVAVSLAHDDMEPRVRVFSAEGTPRGPWWKPEAPRMHRSMAQARVRLSPDGGFLAVVAPRWREPSFVQVWNLSTGEVLPDVLDARGRDAAFQNVGFSSVRFVRTAGAQPRLLLMTASRRGEAAIHHVQQQWLERIGGNEHLVPALAVSTDVRGAWLVSVSDDAEVLVRDLARDAPLGPPISFGQPVEYAARTGNDRLTAYLRSGDTRTFELVPPRVPPPLPAHEHPEPVCVRGASTAHGAPEPIARAQGARSLALDASRTLTVAPGGARRFDHPLALACLSDGARFVLTTRADFVTQVWPPELEAAVGPPIVHRRFFGPGETPNAVASLRLATGGGRLLTRTSFWDAPNVQHTWVALWDVATGMPLMDRVHLAEDDGDATNDASVLTDAHLLAFLPPDDVAADLPDLMEALAGIALDAAGLPVPTPNREAILKRLLPGR